MWSAGFKVVDIKVYFLASGDGPVKENKVICWGERRTAEIKSWIKS